MIWFSSQLNFFSVCQATRRCVYLLLSSSIECFVSNLFLFSTFEACSVEKNTKVRLHGICVTSAQSTHSLNNNTYFISCRIHRRHHHTNGRTWSYIELAELIVLFQCTRNEASVSERTRMAIASIMTAMALITHKLLSLSTYTLTHRPYRIISGLFGVCCCCCLVPQC